MDTPQQDVHFVGQRHVPNRDDTPTGQQAASDMPRLGWTHSPTRLFYRWQWTVSNTGQTAYPAKNGRHCRAAWPPVL